MSKVRIIKKGDEYYPQYYHNGWLFKEWRYFTYSSGGNDGGPFTEEPYKFNSLESAKKFLNPESDEVVYEA